MTLTIIYLALIGLGAIAFLPALLAEREILRQYRAWSFRNEETMKFLRRFSDVGIVFWSAGCALALIGQLGDWLLITQVVIALTLVALKSDHRTKGVLALATKILKDRYARLEIAAYLTIVLMVPYCVADNSWLTGALLATTLGIAGLAWFIVSTREAQDLAEWEALC